MTSTELRDRLLARAAHARVPLEDKHLDPLETYFRLLTQWNRVVNLTALQLDPPSDEALDRLLLEPIAASPYVPDGGFNWIDLGSGGGSPAVPLKILRPASFLKMFEARGRKAAFLREAVRRLELANVTVMNERFEVAAERPELAASADLVTVRGVRSDSVLERAAARILHGGGRILVFGSPDLDEWKEFRAARAPVQLLPAPWSRLSVLAPIARD